MIERVPQICLRRLLSNNYIWVFKERSKRGQWGTQWFCQTLRKCIGPQNSVERQGALKPCSSPLKLMLIITCADTIPQPGLKTTEPRETFQAVSDMKQVMKQCCLPLKLQNFWNAVPSNLHCDLLLVLRLTDIGNYMPLFLNRAFKIQNSLWPSLCHYKHCLEECGSEGLSPRNQFSHHFSELFAYLLSSSATSSRHMSLFTAGLG